MKQKQKIKKLLDLSTETLHELENKQAAIGGDGTDATRPTCCP